MKIKYFYTATFSDFGKLIGNRNFCLKNVIRSIILDFSKKLSIKHLEDS